jgi:hypothetical protein
MIHKKRKIPKALSGHIRMAVSSIYLASSNMDPLIIICSKWMALQGILNTPRWLSPNYSAISNNAAMHGSLSIRTCAP